MTTLTAMSITERRERRRQIRHTLHKHGYHPQARAMRSGEPMPHPGTIGQRHEVEMIFAALDLPVRPDWETPPKPAYDEGLRQENKHSWGGR